MTNSTLERPRLVVPVRACSRCDKVDDVFHLTMVGRLWLCRECHRKLSFPAAAATVAAAADDTPEASTETATRISAAARLHRIDVTLRWGGLALKLLAYVGFLALAARHPIATSLLLGFFIADSASWMLNAWFDARFHGRAITVEAVLYTALFVYMQSSGGFALPADPGARFLAAGTAALTLAARCGSFWWKLRASPY